MESILVYDYFQYGSFGFPDVYSNECDIIRTTGSFNCDHDEDRLIFVLFHTDNKENTLPTYRLHAYTHA